ncbi:MAG TPA: hypothetical protein VGW33_00180 [Terriglobia bacterium]|nr:hypothetical protein [Terriglobia bacterium]
MVDTAEIGIKEKKPGQRACDQKDVKGELCLGHLKRWYTPDAEAVKQAGKDAEIYRCERCHTLYRPAATDDSSVGLRYDRQPVTLLGSFGHKK